MAKGIDVSKWQGNIDWAAVKTGGVAFAMLRASVGTAADSRFAQYAAGAAAAGIPIGTLVLFLLGLACAAGGLIALYLSKRRRQPVYDDWEDEDEEDY